MNPIDQAMSEGVRAAYRRGQEEESMEPLCRVDDAGQPVGRIQDGDFVIFYDIRGEREVELTEAFVRPRGVGFPVDPELAVNFATMIEYDAK
ncbi:MAG: phosphoglycerate mutase (2,3-diphosphoglycerate-independent), partial [Candidatus Polarisedimenticolia bacterium]